MKTVTMSVKPECYVGIDTSNYTTSIAACDSSGRVVANLKAPLLVKDGERGLRQSDAVFAHVKNLPALMDEFSCCIRDFAPVAVGVSTKPRALEGSYMPCFLSGISAAHAFAAQSSLPIYETAHQNGHIMAALYSSGEIENLMSGDFLAFHVSGGTTEVLKVTPNSTKTDFNIELVGESKDINAGQAIDRVGVMMGLAFPAGRELERLAQSYDGELEKRRISVRNGCCNLSGVENIAKQMYDNGAGKNAVAAFTFDFIERTLTEMAEQIFDKHQRMPILFAGGVMSNKIMRQRLSERFDAYFAEPEFSSDNAAGVALLCRLKHAENKENG